MADSAPFVERFVFQFGSPNISYASELCNWHKENGHAFTFGRGMPTPDYIHSDLIILWGHNPTNTVLSQAHAIGEARKAGAKLIVVDPRETALAREADVWLRVRPSSDAALALGIAGALIDRDQYDHTFVSRWSNGALLVRDDNGLFLRGGDLGLTPADAYVYWDHEAGKPGSIGRGTAGRGEAGAERGGATRTFPRRNRQTVTHPPAGRPSTSTPKPVHGSPSTKRPGPPGSSRLSSVPPPISSRTARAPPCIAGPAWSNTPTPRRACGR